MRSYLIFWRQISQNFGGCLRLIVPGDSDGKESACNAGASRLIPGFGRSPREGNSYLLPYSCLENSMDRRDWKATVHGVSKSWTQLEWLIVSFFPLRLALPEVFNSQELSTPESLAVCQLKFRFSCSVIGSWCSFCSWVSVVVNCDHMY